MGIHEHGRRTARCTAAPVQGPAGGRNAPDAPLRLGCMMVVMFVAPRMVTDPASCRWYHTMDLPELGTVGGNGWDLRATIDDYLGRFDFTGMRCMDIGSASGYLTFELERRGARQVVSVDVDAERHCWDIVP